MAQRFTHHLAEHEEDPGAVPLTPLTIIRTETVLSRLPIHNLAKKGSVQIRGIRTIDAKSPDLIVM